ncbi:MAG: YgjV family protein [Patescibacteria group bacterium]
MTNFLHNFWFVQSIGILAIVFSIWSWNSNIRKKILELQAVNALLLTIHYYLLGAMAGALMSAIILVRNVVYEKKTNHPWAAHKVWYYVFIFLSLAGTFYSWKGIVTLLPAIAVIIANEGLYRDKPDQIRVFILIACFLWIPYTIVVHSYSGLASNIIAALGIMIGIYRLDRKNKAEIKPTATI